MLHEWICSKTGKGINPRGRDRSFPVERVGLVEAIENETARAWFIGVNERWQLALKDLQAVNVIETGDRFPRKICHTCHCLFPVDQFAKNQTGKGAKRARAIEWHEDLLVTSAKHLSAKRG